MTDFNENMEDTAKLNRVSPRKAVTGSDKKAKRARRKPHPRQATPRQEPVSTGTTVGFIPSLPERRRHMAPRPSRRRGTGTSAQGSATTRAYGRSALVGGLVGSLMAVLLSWLICGYPGMWSRRAEVVAEMAAIEPEWSDWRGDFPPISWKILYDDKKASTRVAVLDDIRNMLDPDAGFGLFSWPALPYMVGTGHASDCEELLKMVDGIYNDYPELSVYTDGQCLQAIAAVARYMLPAAAGVRAEDNKAECEAVTKRLDELEAICNAAAGASDSNYITEAYRLVASGCVYSSDDSESPHANDIYGALIEGESRCYGGSCAMKALLDRRGIPSFMASGVLNGDPTMRHAWNLLWYDGSWHVCDVTCSMGQTPEEDSSFYYACLIPYEEYKETHNVLIDEEDKVLMEAYEEQIGVLPLSKGASKRT